MSKSKGYQASKWRRCRAVLQRYVPSVRAEILRRWRQAGDERNPDTLLRVIHRYDNGKWPQ